MNIGETSKLASIAIQYGPFFFSVLFCIFLSRWGYSIYNKANVRVKPKAANAKELATYRLYFVATTLVGILLVLMSVIWWILQQNKVHVFQGKIINVEEKHEFVSSELYLKRVEIGEFGGSASPIKVYDWEFFCIQREPFKLKRKFSVLHKKIGGRMEKASIDFSRQGNLKYEIDFDGEKNKNYLKLIAGQVRRSGYPGLLYASPPVQQQKIPFQKLQYTPRVTPDLVFQKIVELQRESTHLGTKIECVDFLSSLARQTSPGLSLPVTLKIITAKEPVILTLLDLSRHTDRELAYKAGRLVNQVFNVHNYLKAGIQSNDTRLHQTVELILFRIERQRMMGILNSIPHQGQNDFYRRIKAQIEAGQKSRVLVPTGTAGGDRYYVHVRVTAEGGNTILCLARLLQSRLPFNMKVDNEVRILQRRRYRTFYVLFKEKALLMADEMERCGAECRFMATGFTRADR